MSIKIKELPILERPYEKLELYGVKKLSDAELLAIIIKTGTKEDSAVQIAQKILRLENLKGDIHLLSNLEIENFMQIKGIGKVKAIQLKAVCELAVRMSRPTNYQAIIIRKPEDIAKLLMQELRYEKREIVKVVLLNIANKIVKMVDIAIGSSNYSLVNIRDILSEAIKINVPKIILIHNHPSGEVKPSKEDIELTKRLIEASELMGIELLDHIIIGDMKYTSILSEVVEKMQETI